MKLFTAFVRLVRFTNLVFIALTQLLFFFCIVRPIFLAAGTSPVFTIGQLAMLILSSVLIAAGGYIINDYFDIEIDQVNKPQRNVVDRLVSRRWAMLWHSLFSFVGVAIGFYIGWKISVFWIGFMNLICVMSLFIYSTSLKKKLLTGNILISLLTAWAVAVVGLAHHYHVYNNSGNLPVIPVNRILRLTILYSGFAFIISLVREVIKDIEDMAGDARFGSRTMPIAWGLNATKVFVAVWIVVLIASVTIIQFYILQFQWWWPMLYCFSAIIVPLAILLYRLVPSTLPEQFHQLSNLSKFIMLTGILSMCFFVFYL